MLVKNGINNKRKLQKQKLHNNPVKKITKNKNIEKIHKLLIITEEDCSSSSSTFFLVFFANLKHMDPL